MVFITFIFIFVHSPFSFTLPLSLLGKKVRSEWSFFGKKKGNLKRGIPWAIK